MNKVNFTKTQDDSNPISNSFQASFPTTFHQKNGGNMAPSPKQLLYNQTGKKTICTSTSEPLTLNCRRKSKLTILFFNQAS